MRFGRWLVCGICFCVVASVALSTHAQALTIATEKEALPIVISAQASVLERYAAEELRAGLTAITGVTNTSNAAAILTDENPLPDAGAIVLGETRYTTNLLGVTSWQVEKARCGSDGFHIAAKGPYLVAYGSRVRGALYAAYEILERFGGVLYLSSWHTLTPPKARVEVPSNWDVFEKPAFAGRTPFWFDVKSHPAFAARLRVNEIPWGCTEAKYGLGAFRFGKGLGICHTFDTLCPSEKYFAAHPEYFSEVKGKRIKVNTQLCLTNPNVLEIVTSNVLHFIACDKEAPYFGVSQNDNGNVCTCAKCKAVDAQEGSPSGTYLRFINEVAARVERVYPGKIIETLAYVYTRKPPKKTRPRSNVMICMAIIECDQFLPIEQTQSANTHDFISYFRDWSAMCENIFVWDYAANFRHYTLPFPNLRALEGNIRFFQKQGVKWLFEQGSYQGNHGDFAEMKAWLVAKWMWNPNYTYTELSERFLKGYFGKAAPYARAVLEATHAHEAAFEADGAHPLTIYRQLGNSCLDDAFLVHLGNLWQRAKMAVSNEPPVYAYNVKMAALGVDYAQLLRDSRTLWVSDNPQKYAETTHRMARAKRFIAQIQEGNIRLTEHADENTSEIERFKRVAQGKGFAVSPGALQAPIHIFRSNSCYTQRGEDPTAQNGKALVLPNTHHEWSAQWYLNELGYDTNALYRVRFHIKVKRPEKAPPGEVFWAGIYDTHAKKALANDLSMRGEKVPCNEWLWCETPPFKPNDTSFVWFAPGRFKDATQTQNPAFSTISVDAFEIVKVP